MFRLIVEDMILVDGYRSFIFPGKKVEANIVWVLCDLSSSCCIWENLYSINLFHSFFLSKLLINSSSIDVAANESNLELE